MGRQDWETETLIPTTGGVFDDAAAFKPSHFTRGKDGKPDNVNPPLSADADKGDQDIVVFTGDGVTADPISANEARTYTHEGLNFRLHNCVGRSVCATGDRSHALTTRSAVEEDGTGRWTPIVPSVAFKPGQSEAAGGTFVTEEFAPTVQSQNNGSTAVPAVAIGFKQGANHSGACGGLTEECEPPLTCGQDHNLVAFTKAKRAQSNTDDESWVPGDVAPTQNQFDQGDTRATTVVAFTQNSRDEVRLINDDGKIAGSIGADGGMHQTNYLAFANRSRNGVKVPEVMKDGVVPALTNPGGGGRSDAVNVVAFKPGQGADSRSVGASDEVCCTLEGSANGNAGHKVAVQSAMQVRRLTPRECAYLQGFPADYLDITFRKKPAADGPKYRALGNSMAVPCMWWLGMRIHNATSHA